MRVLSGSSAFLSYECLCIRRGRGWRLCACVCIVVRVGRGGGG